MRTFLLNECDSSRMVEAHSFREECVNLLTVPGTSSIPTRRNAHLLSLPCKGSWCSSKNIRMAGVAHAVYEVNRKFIPGRSVKVTRWTVNPLEHEISVAYETRRGRVTEDFGGHFLEQATPTLAHHRNGLAPSNMNFGGKSLTSIEKDWMTTVVRKQAGRCTLDGEWESWRVSRREADGRRTHRGVPELTLAGVVARQLAAPRPRPWQKSQLFGNGQDNVHGIRGGTLLRPVDWCNWLLDRTLSDDEIKLTKFEVVLTLSGSSDKQGKSSMLLSP